MQKLEELEKTKKDSIELAHRYIFKVPWLIQNY